MPQKPVLYLVDGSSYIYRAFHAIRGLSNSKGMPTNAAFGFTKMMIKLLEDKNPEYIAILFDHKGPVFRHEIFPEYKANRPPMPDDLSVQIPYIKKITKGLCLPMFEVEGYEADDLIGTLAVQGEKAGFQVVMVTGDKDFLQLVTKNISLWDPMKDKSTNLEDIRRDMGVEPWQMTEVMGLSGDTSDNIPGVPGIGIKTALTLIKTYSDMDNLYKRVHTIKKKKQHENLVKFRDQAMLSRKLVTIAKDAPIKFDPEKLKKGEPDSKILTEIFKELEFGQFLDIFSKPAEKKSKEYKIILKKKELSELLAEVEKQGKFAIDTETTSQSPMLAKLVGISIAARENRAYYIPCGHDYENAPDQIDIDELIKLVKPVLENPKIKKIGQNIKYDSIVLSRHGINMDGVFFDTMIASYLLNPSKRAHGLDRIARDFLDHKTTTYGDVAGKGKKEINFSKVSLEKAGPYACEDADITFMAYKVLKKKVDEIGLTNLMNEVEIPLIPVLKKMEMTGISVDKEKLEALSASFATQLENLEDEIYKIAGEKFNIKSSKQLGEILFEKLGLPIIKKTKKTKGYSTDVEVLTRLAQDHDLPALILRHRSLAKLKSTYSDALLSLIHPETGRIHTSYNQTVTATGRLSSSEPNLQNIPIRTPEGIQIREAFVPRNGWCFLSVDYSQIELRLLAHYSEDENLMEAFDKGEDIHTRTASHVFGIEPGLVSQDLRRQAKAINFGIIYGMGPFSLSKELGISRKMAQRYIENYFETYRGVKEFIEKTIEKTRKTGKTSTLLGRIRLLPEINSSNKNIRSFAERTAVNTPIQGTAADLIKLAMIKVDKALCENKLKSAMLLTVHDELVFEVPPSEKKIVKNLVTDIMENIRGDLKVPLKVNAAFGDNWACAH